MNRNAFIRALVAVVGLFAIVRGLEQLQPLSMILALTSRHSVDYNWFVGIAAALLVPILLFIVGGALLVSPPARLSEVFPDEDSSGGSGLQALCIFQVAAVFCGVLVLSWCLPDIIQMAVNLTYRGWTREEFLAGTWPTLAGFVLQLAIGVYLLFGAPHLVRWQVRKLEGLRTARGLPEE